MERKAAGHQWGFAGIYPWDWARDDREAFRALSGDSKDALLVAPIIQTLILNRKSVETLDWVDTVCKWDFTPVVPAHLKNNIEAGPSSFRRAFSFLTVEGEPSGHQNLEGTTSFTRRGKNFRGDGGHRGRPGLVSKTNRAEVALAQHRRGDFGAEGGRSMKSCYRR